MLPGIAPLALSTGYILAGLITCEPQPAPELTFNLQNTPPQIDNTQSSRDLAGLKGNSTSPRYGSEFPIVGGLTASDFKAEFTMNFSKSFAKEGNDACLWIKDAVVTITYTPVVYVASNYRPGSCRYNLTEEHEMMHVGVDTITLKEFMPYIEQVANSGVAQAYSVGPIDREEIDAEQNRLAKKLSTVLQEAIAQLQQARRMRQQQVDSRVEYRRLSTSCLDEPAH